MMTLRRFKRLADSYGADLRRWPEEERGAAQALLKASPEASALLDQARRLDDAIEAASAREGGALRRPGEQEAALARLRAGVEARIASSAGRAPAGGRIGRWTGKGGLVLSPPLRWTGIAASGGIAIIAGLLIGSMYTTAPSSDDVLTMLEPAPIHMLAE